MTMRNVSISTQIILILSGLKILVVTVSGGSWVIIRFFTTFLQFDPETVIGGIIGLVGGWGLSEVFLAVVLFFSDVVRFVLSVGLGLTGQTGDADESVMVEEARDMESQ